MTTDCIRGGRRRCDGMPIRNLLPINWAPQLCGRPPVYVSDQLGPSSSVAKALCPEYGVLVADVLFRRGFDFDIDGPDFAGVRRGVRCTAGACAGPRHARSTSALVASRRPTPPCADRSAQFIGTSAFSARARLTELL